MCLICMNQWRCWVVGSLHFICSIKWFLIWVFYFISYGQFFFYLISNKDIYSRNYLMQKNIRQREKYNGREREKRKKEGKERILITQERAKEQREGITRGESPSPRPVK